MFKWFRNLRFSFKLIIGFGSIFLLVLIATGIINYFVFYNTLGGVWEEHLLGISDNVYKLVKSNVESQVQQKLRVKAEANKEISTHFYNLYLDDELTREEAKNQALKIIKSQKVGEKGFVFVMDGDGKIIMHPNLYVGYDMSDYAYINEVLENNTEEDTSEENTNEESTDEDNTRDKKTGFIEPWNDEENKWERNEVIYLTYFEEWNWVIAATLIVDEYNTFIDKTIFKDDMLDIKIGETDYPYIINEKGILEIHPYLEGNDIYNLTDENDELFVQEMLNKKNGTTRYLWEDQYEQIRWKTAYYQYYEKMDWLIAIAIYEEEIYAPLATQVLITLIIIGGAFLLLIPLVIFYSIMVTRPLKKVRNVIDTMYHGNLSVRSDIDTKDEFGSLSNSINGLSERFEKMISSVVRSVEGFYGATTEISEGNQDLSQRTSQQASSLQEITASIEEMLDKIDNTLKRSEKAKDLSMTIKNEIEKLNESSKQMHEIIQVIESISFETNLLALNASIEAARAGEAGRGFEVVATEVKELSQRSSSQAKEIYAIIEDNISRIKHNVSLVDEIDDIIAEITESSKDQHHTSHQISESISQLNHVTQENASLVEEAAAASEEISTQAKSLKDEVSFFSSENIKELPTALDEVVPSEKKENDDKVKKYIDHVKNENNNENNEEHHNDETKENLKKF